METKYKTGIQRFYKKYPNYQDVHKNEDQALNIGATIIPPNRNQNKGINEEVD